MRQAMMRQSVRESSFSSDTFARKASSEDGMGFEEYCAIVKERHPYVQVSLSAHPTPLELRSPR
jgi:hypothetical protein